MLIATREAAPETPLAEAAPHDIEPGTPGEQEVCEESPPVSQSSDRCPISRPNRSTMRRAPRSTTCWPNRPKKHAKASAAAKGAAKKHLQEATATNGVARRSAALHATATTFEPVKFQEIDGGNTSKHELITAWGQPAETGRSDEGDVLTFRKVAVQGD